MYDLEIMVPAELDVDKIYQRLNDFKKWGLQKHEESRIKIYFMVSANNSQERISEFCENWPSNIDVKAIETPYRHVSQRIMYYYSEIIQPDTARWYMRVDEDSMTDIRGLMSSLNSWFDWNRDYHITGEVSGGIEDIEYQILKRLGYQSWYKDVKEQHFDVCAPVHEIEISITSNSAIQRIFSEPSCRELFKIRREFPESQGDHTFAWAARMVKIYPQCVYFLTREADFANFSGYGGYKHHIHDTSRERSPLVRWLEFASGENQELRNELTSTNYLLKWQNLQTALWIAFDPYGKISNIKNKVPWTATESFGIWGVSIDGNLTILPRDISLTREFGDGLYAPIEFRRTQFGFTSINSPRNFDLHATNANSKQGMKLL